MTEAEEKEAQQAGYTPEIWADMDEKERRLALQRAANKPAAPEAPPVPPAGVRLDFSAMKSTLEQQLGPSRPPVAERRFDDEPVPGAFEPRRVVIPDLVGDRAPRTLEDVYGRFPVGRPGGEHFFIRVERTQPKAYQGVPVSGFVGKITDRISEEDFAQRFGGREYQLTVYGPDPRGQTDDYGQPIIKALTDSIKYTVSIYPPNLSTLNHDQGQRSMGPMNPFGGGGYHGPTTQADASIHKTNTDFLGTVLKDLVQQRPQTDSSNAALEFAKEQAKLQADRFKEEAQARDAAWRQQLEAASKQQQELKEELRVLKEGAQKATGTVTESTLELVRALGPNRQQESDRLNQYHQQQMDSLRHSHEEGLKLLRTQHEAEVRRHEERYREQETYYNRRLVDQKTSYEEQIKALRDEVDRVRRDAREDADRRIQDLKDQQASELRAMEKAHERELRNLKENYDVRLDTRDKTYEMERNTFSQRESDLRRSVEEAQKKVEEASDLSVVLERGKANAELLGYSKPEGNEPKTPLERLAATAGTGIGQALSTIDTWGPAMIQGITQRNAAQAQAAAAQQQQVAAAATAARLPSHPTPPQPQPRRRAATLRWGAEGVETTDQPVVDSTTDLGFQSSDPEPTPEGAPKPTEDTGAVAAESDMQQAQLPDVAIPEKFEGFTKEMVFGFLNTCDQYINMNADPYVFADGFNSRFPEEAKKLVNAGVSATDVTTFVKQIPDSEGAAVLRREGQVWLERMLKKLQEVAS